MPVKLTRGEIEELKALDDPKKIKALVQDRCFLEWKRALCRGTVEAATGVGKTRIAVLAVKEELERNPEAVVWVCVPTQTLRDKDWPDEFRLWGAEHLLDRVNFVCHVSMDTVRSETGEIDLVIFDEVHNITLSNHQLFQQNKVYKVMGLTATLPPESGYETDQEKLLLINALCPSVIKISLEEAIELRLVSDFEVYVMKFDLDSKSLHVKGGTKAKPRMTTETARYKYLSDMVQRSAWQKPEMKFVWIAKRMTFLYTLRQKEIIARDVLKYIMDDEGTEKRTLIFCGSIEQAERMCGENVFHSKLKGKERNRYLTLFQEHKIPYLGVVQALNEGANIDALDQILVIQLNSRELDIIQRIGRTIRFREGHVARVIVLVARNTVDEKWYKTAFENFDKSRIKEFYVQSEAAAAGASK